MEYESIMGPESEKEEPKRKVRAIAEDQPEEQIRWDKLQAEIDELTKLTKASAPSFQPRRDKREVECFFCHKKGHYQSECFQKCILQGKTKVGTVEPSVRSRWQFLHR